MPAQGRFQNLPKSCLQGCRNGLPKCCPNRALGGPKQRCPNLAHFLPQVEAKMVAQMLPISCLRAKRAGKEWTSCEQPFWRPLRQDLGKIWASHFDTPGGKTWANSGICPVRARCIIGLDRPRPFSRDLFVFQTRLAQTGPDWTEYTVHRIRIKIPPNVP